VHPGDLAQGCSDLDMTSLLCCAGAATVYPTLLSEFDLLSRLQRNSVRRHGVGLIRIFSAFSHAAITT